MFRDKEFYKYSILVSLSKVLHQKQPSGNFPFELWKRKMVAGVFGKANTCIASIVNL